MKSFKEYILEGKMVEVTSDLESMLDKDIKKFKKSGGGEWIATKLLDAAKKISKEYEISIKDATKLVNSYFEDATS